MEKFVRNNFNKLVLDATYNAQKKYGFQIGTGEHATWNNEADAFKHAYMQWYLSWYYSPQLAKKLGDMHEDETPNAPAGERNMDLWNNSIGREIAYEMKEKAGDDWDLLLDENINEIASKKIVEKMRRGELITTPQDKRKFENMELERLSETDRVYSDGEYRNFGEKVNDIIMNRYLEDVISNNWEIPSEDNLKKRVRSGELIYVRQYSRADGTEIKGYYRRKPVR